MTSSAPPHGDPLNGQHFSPTSEETLYGQPSFSAPPNASFETSQNYAQSYAPKQDPSPIHPTGASFTDFPLYPPPPESQKVHGLFEQDFGPDASGSINPAELMNQSQLPVDPQLQQHSPHLPQHEYVESSGFEWNAIMGSQNPSWSHRRAPSEYSDISSAAASPFLATQEFGDPHSPLLQPQHGSMQDLLNSDLNFEGFTLQDTSRDHSRSVSPAPQIHSLHHSAANSPFLMPQNDHMLNMVPTNIPQMEIPQMELHVPPQAPPEVKCEPSVSRPEDAPQINVIPAPPQKQFAFPKPLDSDGLFPPQKVRRGRSKSDPYVSGSIPNLNIPSSSLSPLSGHAAPHHRHSRRSSLSPADIPSVSSSRNPSPDRVSKPLHHGHHRRSSTNSVPNNRDHILEMVHPNRPGAPVLSEPKRTQKHPATYQCNLCPKRFTRAYNLRSHLRTHTDERPFVCTVCGKAFARQHDRKRHEGLHSGEKKFSCRGTLKSGNLWGCGRKFARADALGRHFRSEAGRVCIRPLLEEETAERAARGSIPGGVMHPAGILPSQHFDPGIQTLHSQPPHPHHQHHNPHILPTTAPEMTFPSALLDQFPDLRSFAWGMMEPGPEDDGEIDGIDGYGGRSGDESVSGRSSFDAGAPPDYDSYDERGWGSDTGGGGGPGPAIQVPVGQGMYHNS
ncbi:hypothetical protein EX30DRAFT_379227 [Ascodesmis nigricans]|uniref:C2H2-type domain-containing protein n=1 Tax=Ascodesmis nigricans TaxID=341454 RepID=A0A4S2MUR5_9PEZI|nr:hypothetical protein EX30DRAFT_379227 [Ascodesmis nigricans]